MYSIKVDENYFYQGAYAKIGKVEGSINMPSLPPEENALCYYANPATGEWIFSQEKFNEFEAQRIADEEAEAEQESEEQFIQNLPAYVKQQRADIDYIALMSGVMLEDYPIMPIDDYSYKYHDIKKYYDNNLWSAVRVRNMVAKNIITAEEYKLITKEDYINN